MPSKLALSRARHLTLMAATVLAVAGCDKPEQAPVQSTTPVQSSAQDNGLAPDVVAALEAAARGEPFKDDLEPNTAMTSKALSALQSGYDVRHYGLSIRIKPETHSLEGVVDVTFTAVERLEAIELNLDPKLSVSKATLDGESLETTHENNSLIITLPAALEKGARATVSVAYGGKPHIALAPPWYGGFVWSETEGTPWFATAVQTEGCDLWWPCKDHHGDKPEEGINVNISAPSGVKIGSAGVLDGVTKGDDGFDTWHWSSRHPYTGYAIAINGGPYEIIETDYKGINGTSFPIQFWALPKNIEKARALIDSDAIPHLAFFERILGPYPWGDEKVGFIETPHLGMEHQTMNGYGEQFKKGTHGFDQLLHHELAHEWFGNLITHKEPKDSWVHEGYGAYMQMVYTEELIGDLGYMDRMFSAYTSTSNCLPVANDAVSDVSEAFENRDIYTKGSWMLHTLRRHIGEEAFWNGTRRLLYGTAEPWSLPYPIKGQYRSTDDFIRIMNDEAGKDVAWLIEAYLYEADLPKLETDYRNGALQLSWNMPGDRPFPMPVPVSINGKTTVVSMDNKNGEVTVPDNARIILDPQSTIMRALPIIGDCSAQTDKKVAYNIERFTRMAKEYGWQRD